MGSVGGLQSKILGSLESRAYGISPGPRSGGEQEAALPHPTGSPPCSIVAQAKNGASQGCPIREQKPVPKAPSPQSSLKKGGGIKGGTCES
jgi:hypothetical protein